MNHGGRVRGRPWKDGACRHENARDPIATASAMVWNRIVDLLQGRSGVATAKVSSVLARRKRPSGSKQ